jgi:hypothetical protein
MTEQLHTHADYSSWLKELKSKIRSVQIKALVKVNTEMLDFYRELGADIVEMQNATKWGDGFLKQLSGTSSFFFFVCMPMTSPRLLHATRMNSFSARMARFIS